MTSNNNLTGLTITGITFNTGAGAHTMTGNAITLGGNVTNNSANDQTISLNLILSGSRTFGAASGNLNVSSIISQSSAGVGVLVKTGSSTLTLSNQNTYTGGTTINAGTLALGHATNTLSNTGAVTVDGATAILSIAGNSDTVGAVSLRNGGQITGSGGTLTGSSYSLQGGTVSANLGTGNMTVTTGTTTLSGTAASTAININSGTLALGANNRLADAAAISLAGGTLDIAGFNDTVGAVTLSSGSITGNGGVLTGSSYAVQAGSVSAILGGNAALTKSSAGTVTLSGANTYTGSTIISGGVLALESTGSIDNSSGVVLNNANFNVSAVDGGYSVSSLTGIGSVTGDLTVSGTLGIGASPGTITFNDDLILASSSISDFEITLGFSAYDLANSGFGTQTVTFGGTLNLLFESGFNTTGSVKIFDFENYSGGFASVTTTGLAPNYTATFDQTTGILTVVPEPKAALLGSLGALALLRRRRDC